METKTFSIRRCIFIALQLSILTKSSIHTDPVATSTVVVRPNAGTGTAAATLIPAQPLHFECSQIGKTNAQFIWYRKSLGEESQPQLLEPNADDTIEIHNERLTLLKPTYSYVGDYICRALNEDKSENENEFATIKVRNPPYIEDFGIETSHTGKSSVINDGERLELICKVRDETTPVNITWLRSMTADDDRNMVPLTEVDHSTTTPASQPTDPFTQTFTAPDNIIVETLTNFSKKLVIESVRPEHRSYYACMVDNGVTERARRTIFIRVKDKIVALWPFLGIVAELFILFTIIHVWETQRAYKAMQAKDGPASSTSSTGGNSGGSSSKRPASGPSVAFENVPLNS